MLFEIANETYTSKAAIERHYRAIIQNRPPGFVFDQSHPDFDFLHALLMHHDRRKEKMGHARVKEFFVVTVPGAKGLWIRRWDGTETDLSLLKVIQRLGMTDQQKARYDLVRTMRDEIEDQIEDYRRRAMTDAAGGLVGMHVDHHDPPFAQLVEGFLTENKLDPTAVPITHGECGSRCTITDRSIATAWHDYHRRHAALRLLTPEQNLRRQTPKIDWQRVEGHATRDHLRGRDAMDWPTTPTHGIARPGELA